MSGREPTKDPKYLFQIDGGAVDFFKTRPPSPSAAAADLCNTLQFSRFERFLLQVVFLEFHERF